ncbi:hypothetical protein ATJ93_4254 [Halopiger aswanensis]|uniref:Uncharacterized protein n=1 Tax=Halopiger aswanensis TaxID=148449 RepID=A0A3R7DAM5_9EURY|nr:hypothetical protein ATJ93_4254 [Halopiger aswanensis]
MQLLMGMPGVRELTEENRGLAICEHCGAAYAVRILEDGQIHPIGRDTCSCGSDDFRLLE